MKKLFYWLLVMGTVSFTLQSMEEEITGSKKRKREEPSAQEVQTSKQVKTSEIEFLDLAPELQELILLTALNSSPRKALKRLKVIEQVNKDLYSWARNHAKKAACTWVNRDSQQASDIFVKAAHVANQQIFDALLEARINVDRPNSKNATALHAATGAGHAAIVNQLIESGAAIGLQTILAINDRPDIARILLATGEAVLSARPHGTGLLCAVISGQKKRVKKILKKGINPDTFDVIGMTALLYAAAIGNREMVKLLLKKGANVNYIYIRSKTKLTPLLLAVGHEKPEIVKLLLDAGAIVDRDDTRSPIEVARKHGSTEIESLLIEADNSQKTPQGYEQFARACDNKDTISIANFIDSHSSEQKKLNEFLLFAIKKGDKPAVKKLIKYGADINSFAFDGKSALSIAAYYGQLKIVQILLKKDVTLMPDVNGEKKTPLIHAIIRKQMEITHLLLRARRASTTTFLSGQQITAWEIDLADASNSTPLSHAINLGDRDLVAFILQADPTISFFDTSVITAARLGHTEIVSLLLDRNFNFGRDRGGNTPLMFAASGGHTQMVRSLLNRGIGIINMQDNKQHTPLMSAARYGHRETVEVLLAHNADTSLINIDGLTALDFAAKYSHHEIVNILQNFKQNNVQVN